jgi:hypothetical protein
MCMMSLIHLDCSTPYFIPDVSSVHMVLQEIRYADEQP